MKFLNLLLAASMCIASANFAVAAEVKFEWTATCEFSTFESISKDCGMTLEVSAAAAEAKAKAEIAAAAKLKNGKISGAINTKITQQGDKFKWSASCEVEKSNSLALGCDGKAESTEAEANSKGKAAIEAAFKSANGKVLTKSKVTIIKKDKK